LTGDVPSPSNVPSGCYFHPRCPKVFGDCSTIHPVLAGSESHMQSCLLYPESYPKTNEERAA
ncbi:MAG TPA: peptide ABC transporter substrate-binding protein, partial [Ignavibacteria bacterium]|nr:peptide ABC transporter substrate-binding protein [Ignavibacteria bacterium]